MQRRISFYYNTISLICFLNIFSFAHSEALSSFALLDSKILDPPDDPDDIFGFGENYKEEAFGNEFEIIGCNYIFGVLK